MREMNDWGSSFIAEFQTKVTETYDDFIFEQISPFVNSVTQQKISKQELVNALLRWRDLEKENDRLREEIRHIKAESKCLQEVASFDCYEYYYWTKETSELRSYRFVKIVRSYDDGTVMVESPYENERLIINRDELVSLHRYKTEFMKNSSLYKFFYDKEN